jgi:hypothetical protein
MKIPKYYSLYLQKVLGKLFKSSGEEKALRSEKISLGKQSTSQYNQNSKLLAHVVYFADPV